MQETIGHLGKTPTDHKQMRSSGFAFDHLLNKPVNPKIPFGEQMTQAALQTYYDHQNEGVKGILDMASSLDKGAIGVIRGFQADLPFLKNKGVDTNEAESVFETLNALLGE